MKKIFKKIVQCFLIASMMQSSMCLNVSAYHEAPLSHKQDSGKYGDYDYTYLISGTGSADPSTYSLKNEDGVLYANCKIENDGSVDVYKDFNSKHSWTEYGETNVSFDIDMDIDNTKNQYVYIEGTLDFDSADYIEFYISEAWGNYKLLSDSDEKATFLDTVSIDGEEYDIYYAYRPPIMTDYSVYRYQFYSIKKENLADTASEGHYSRTIPVSKHLEIYKKLAIEKKLYDNNPYDIVRNFEKGEDVLNSVGLVVEGYLSDIDFKVNSFSVNTEFDPEKDDIIDNDEINGDINSDGVLNAVDLNLLQKFLLGVPYANIRDTYKADFNKDGTVNILDLCLMKAELLDIQPIAETPVLLIDGYMYTISGMKNFKNVVTTDGTGYISESYDTMGEIEDVINSGEKMEQYVTNDKIFKLIDKIAAKPSDYSFCSMRSFKKNGDYDGDEPFEQTNITLLYTDSNGNSNQLKLFGFGDENEILNHQDVMDLIYMLNQTSCINIQLPDFEVCDPVKVDIKETGGYAGNNNLYSIYENDGEYKLSYTLNGCTDIIDITEKEYNDFMSLDYSPFLDKSPNYYSVKARYDAIYYTVTVTDESGNELTFERNQNNSTELMSEISKYINELKNTYSLE